MENQIILHDFDISLTMLAKPEVFQRRLSERVDQARADAGGDSRNDAAESLIAARDVEQVLAEVLRDEFGPRYSEEYIPLGSFGILPWMERFIQKRITPQGLLDYVNSADMPWIQVGMQEITHKIFTLGAKFGWSWFEMMQAQQGNVSLRTELATATREAAERTKDLILLKGDTSLAKGGGYIPTGLINDPDVPIASLTNGDWGTNGTVDEILADLAAMYSAYRTQTRRIERADTLLVDEASYARLQFLRVGDSGKTLLQFLIDSVADLVKIDVLPELSTAGVGGITRKILYANNPRVLRGITPLDFSFIADETARLRVDVWGVLRMVGLVVMKPFAMIYFDST